MKRRIAKKVFAEEGRKYSRVQRVKAYRRLGLVTPFLSVTQRELLDKGVVVVQGPCFHYRTGNAPTGLPEAIPPTYVLLDELTKGTVIDIPVSSALVGPCYEAMSLVELKESAKAQGLKGCSTMKKADLLALLIGENK